MLRINALVLADHGFAQTTPPVTWDGSTGAYITATNWDPDTTPSNAANQFLSINNGGTAQVGLASGDWSRQCANSRKSRGTELGSHPSKVRHEGWDQVRFREKHAQEGLDLLHLGQ